jgi:rhamnosyltransferase
MNFASSMKFAIIVPTLNPGVDWPEWISAISKQVICPCTILVIDSESVDGSMDAAKQAGFRVEYIEKDSFNHGGTRNLGMRICHDADFLVYMTQDAILADEVSLEKILQPFTDDKVMAVCGRQLPRPGAGAIEAHARLTNYPSGSRVSTASDIPRLGLKTAFISNSYAAYRVSGLREVGGFPDDVIFGEDMYVATRLLKAGYSIAYAADACVYHSHSYTILQEFRRYFDMGVFHAREPWIRQSLGGAESEGFKFVRSEIAYLLRRSPWLIPAALFRTLCRYAGFRLGLAEKRLPVRLKQQLVMNKSYFANKT